MKDPDGRRPEECAARRRRASWARCPRRPRSAARAARARARAHRLEEGRLGGAADGASRTAPRAGSSARCSARSRRRRSSRSARSSRASSGQQVGSALLDVTDDPLVPRGPRLAPLRRRGDRGAARSRSSRTGVLRSYYVDTYYGRKLGIAPTTRGALEPRLVARRAGRRPRSLAEHGGRASSSPGFLGGNSNGTTGDFSLGVQGFRVRGGAARRAGRRDERLRQPPRALEAARGGGQRPVPVLGDAHADAGVRGRAVRGFVARRRRGLVRSIHPARQLVARWHVDARSRLTRCITPYRFWDRLVIPKCAV